MNRLFEIQTLSDRPREYKRLRDPVTIITGGTALLTQLFPNLFGGNRIRLTSADWLKMFPSSGYWTTQLRNELSNTIHYNTDLKNVPEFTKYFVDKNKNSFCPGCSFTEAFSKFSQILREENMTGGQSPVGNFPGIGGSVNWEQILLIGGGAVLLIALFNKKGRKK